MNKPEFKLSGYKTLFGEDTAKRFVKLPVSELHQHPRLRSEVQDDSYLAQLTESIKTQGIIEELRVFPDPEGGYWIISGRHRHAAARKSGFTEVPCIIFDEMTLEEAEIAIAECNLRHELSPMERAWTLRIKREAETRQGHRSDLLGDKEEKTDDGSESERTIQRYIRLTHLIPALQQRIGERGKTGLKVRTGAALSYLNENMQRCVDEYIERFGVAPSMEAAERWKQRSKANELIAEEIESFFTDGQTSSKQHRKISVNYDVIAQYLPEGFTKKQAERLIIELLQEWANDSGDITKTVE